ncbi:hypothetical protein KR222_004609 [Zaprionus bogoriensis]|nr:hypothetical protein KR222_004609 [Zaprionus bogoriensis]
MDDIQPTCSYGLVDFLDDCMNARDEDDMHSPERGVSPVQYSERRTDNTQTYCTSGYECIVFDEKPHTVLSTWLHDPQTRSLQEAQVLRHKEKETRLRHEKMQSTRPHYE